MTSKLDLARNLLLAGRSLDDAARAAGLDVVRDAHGYPMIAAEGWIADEGDFAIEYPAAKSAREAANLYVDGGEWGDHDTTIWVDVSAWRNGLRRAECSYCTEPATAHDCGGSPACADHADPDLDEGCEAEALVVAAQTERETHTIAVDPAEPDCVAGEAHDWAAPHDIVGGIAENPGVWGNGGGIVMRLACLRCGCGSTVDTWAQDPQTGEQGLTSTSYAEGHYVDELRERRDRMVRRAMADLYDLHNDGADWRVDVTLYDADDDEESAAVIDEIRDAVGEWCDVEWAGSSNTDADGVTTSDVSIAWRSGVSARRKRMQSTHAPKALAKGEV